MSPSPCESQNTGRLSRSPGALAPGKLVRRRRRPAAGPHGKAVLEEVVEPAPRLALGEPDELGRLDVAAAVLAVPGTQDREGRRVAGSASRPGPAGGVARDPQAHVDELAIDELRELELRTQLAAGDPVRIAPQLRRGVGDRRRRGAQIAA